MSNYNSTLQLNNTDLQKILNTINELPEAGSGGTDTSDATATASDILSGKTAYIDGEKVTGTIETKTASNLTASGATVTVPAGYYASQATKSIASGSATTPATTVTKNPTILVNSSGLITASVSGTQSVTPMVSAGYVSSGTAGTITVSGSATKQLTTQAAKTITPSTSSQTAVAKNVYTTGAVTVAAIPSNYEDVGTETSVYTTKLASLETAISALETELEGKASGSSGGASVETCTVTVTFSSSGDPTYAWIAGTQFIDGTITALSVIDYDTNGNSDVISPYVITDIVKNSALVISGYGRYSTSGFVNCEGCELLYESQQTKTVAFKITESIASIDIPNGY